MWQRLLAAWKVFRQDPESNDLEKLRRLEKVLFEDHKGLHQHPVADELINRYRDLLRPDWHTVSIEPMFIFRDRLYEMTLGALRGTDRRKGGNNARTKPGNDRDIYRDRRAVRH